MFRSRTTQLFRNIRFLSISSVDKLGEKRMNNVSFDRAIKADKKFLVVDYANENLKKKKRFNNTSTFISGGCAIGSSLLLFCVTPEESHLIMPIVSTTAGLVYSHMYFRGTRDTISDTIELNEKALKTMKDIPRFYSDIHDIDNEYIKIINNLIVVGHDEYERWMEMAKGIFTLVPITCLVGFIYVPLLIFPALLSLNIPYCLGSYYASKSAWKLLREKYINS